MKIKDFLSRVFFHGHWRLTGQQGKVGDYFLFPSTTSTRSRTFRHLIVALQERWLSHVFNRTTCIYQILPPYRITIWLIDDVKFVLVCLLGDLILGFFYSNFDTGGLELASTITLVLQGNRLTKCASVQILPGFKNWNIQDLILRRCDTLKNCQWYFFKFSWIVHYRNICKNQV